MNHVLVFFEVMPFIVGHTGVAMMIERRIRDPGITARRVNILIPCSL